MDEAACWWSCGGGGGWLRMHGVPPSIINTVGTDKFYKTFYIIWRTEQRKELHTYKTYDKISLVVHLIFTDTSIGLPINFVASTFRAYIHGPHNLHSQLWTYKNGSKLSSVHYILSHKWNKHTKRQTSTNDANKFTIKMKPKRCSCTCQCNSNVLKCHSGC